MEKKIKQLEQVILGLVITTCVLLVWLSVLSIESINTGSVNLTTTPTGYPLLVGEHGISMRAGSGGEANPQLNVDSSGLIGGYTFGDINWEASGNYNITSDNLVINGETGYTGNVKVGYDTDYWIYLTFQNGLFITSHLENR